MYNTPSVKCSSFHSPTPIGVMSPGAHAQNSSTPYGSGYQSVPYPICQVFQCPYPHSCWGCVPWVPAQIVQHLMGPVSQVHHTPSAPSSSVHGPFRSGTMSPGAHAQILPQPMGPVSQVFCILWFLSPKCPIPTDFACKSSECYQRAKPLGHHPIYLCICVFSNKLHGSTPQKIPSKPTGKHHTLQ